MTKIYLTSFKRGYWIVAEDMYSPDTKVIELDLGQGQKLMDLYN